MIDKATIARILDAAQILDVVSDFVTLKKRGANFVGLCPFHNEKTPSFSVSPSRGIFKCFGCGKGGNAVTFIMEHEQMTYVEALKWLGKKYHIDVQERELTDEEKAIQNDRESMFILNNFAMQQFMDNLFNTTEGQSVGLSYLRERRHFTDESIRKFCLGYAIDRPVDSFTQSALHQGYKSTFLEKTGLSIRREDGSFYDRFHGRVIFPVHSIAGKVVAFGGRTLNNDKKTAKYVNSPESEIYHKSRELYGIYFARTAIAKADCCILVEGYADVISMHQAGICNVVASSGTALTTDQIRLIHRLTQNITVLYDSDAAGIHASLRGIDMLLEEDIHVKVVLLPDGEDPDSYACNHNADEVIDYIQRHEVDFIRFKTNLLLTDAADDPVKKASVVSDVVRSIAAIPDALLAAEYAKACATQLHVDEKLIHSEINKIKRQRYIQELRRNTAENAAPDVTPTAEVTTLPDTTSSIIIPSNKHDAAERNILFMLVCYGTVDIFADEKNNPVNVGHFILLQFAENKLTMQNPLFARFMDEYKAHCNDRDFVPADYFMKHTDQYLAQLASELLTDRYMQSRLFARQDPEKPMDPAQSKKQEQEAQTHLVIKLGQYVPDVINEYRFELVQQQLNEALKRLQIAQESGDTVTVMEALKQQQALNRQKNALAEALQRNV